MLKINKSKCPECERKIKHYYHYCQCGYNDMIDWKKTIFLWLFAIALLGGGFLFISSVVSNIGAR